MRASTRGLPQVAQRAAHRGREAEAALERSEANFASAFRSNPCAMSIVRLSDSRFQDVNGSFEQQTGFRREEVLGRTAAELGLWINQDDAAAARAGIQRDGKFASLEIRWHTKSGAPATAICSGEVITFRGESCVLATGLDITERQSAESEAKALRDELAHVSRLTMLEALCGSLAHEINQPLTAIMANAEAALHLLAAKPPHLRELRETLTEIVSDNRRAGEVLLRIRSLLKKGASPHEPLDVNGIVRDVLKLVHANAISRRIVLDVELACDLEPVLGDRIQIQQVVLNLLMNAFDAVQDCEPARRQVRLRTRTSSDERAAIVDVSDRGAGLSDEALELVFEPFYTTKQDGMGLGLSICRAIVKAHGGTLEATHSHMKGTTFSARFPFRRSADATQPRFPADRQLQEQE